MQVMTRWLRCLQLPKFKLNEFFFGLSKDISETESFEVRTILEKKEEGGNYVDKYAISL